MFKDGSLELNSPVGPKKRGRPKRLWAQVMMQHAIKAAGFRDRVAETLAVGLSIASCMEPVLAAILHLILLLLLLLPFPYC